MSYASAGHVSGFLMNGSGEVDHVLESSGPPLGLFPASKFSTSMVPLKSQSMVILMTDGTTEMMGSEDEQFGSDGVLEYVRAHRQKSACELAYGIYRAARDFAGDTPQQDDATGVIIKVA